MTQLGSRVKQSSPHMDLLVQTHWDVHCDSSVWLGSPLNKEENPPSESAKPWTSAEQLQHAEESSLAAPAFSTGLLLPSTTSSFILYCSFLPPHSVPSYSFYFFKATILTSDLRCLSMSCRPLLASLRAPGICHCVVVADVIASPDHQQSSPPCRQVREQQQRSPRPPSSTRVTVTLVGTSAGQRHFSACNIKHLPMSLHLY